MWKPFWYEKKSSLCFPYKWFVINKKKNSENKKKSSDIKLWIRNENFLSNENFEFWAILGYFWRFLGQKKPITKKFWVAFFIHLLRPLFMWKPFWKGKKNFPKNGKNFFQKWCKISQPNFWCLNIYQK